MPLALTGFTATSTVRMLLRENGLTIVLMLLFVGSLVPMAVAGLLERNQSYVEHGEAPVGFAQYLRSEHFLEATMENWESEFLQMFLYVILTAFLFQKGSAESKKLDDPDTAGSPAPPVDGDSPWPVRKGGFVLKIYENSLSLAFLVLFVGTFVLHAHSGAAAYSREQVQHGSEGLSTVEYVTSARFWFESLQNWQSEFLSILAMVVFSIYLRQKGSPESKPVESPTADGSWSMERR